MKPVRPDPSLPLPQPPEAGAVPGPDSGPEEYVLRIERRPGGLRLQLREGRAPLQPVTWREFPDTDALLRHLWTLLEPGGLR
ncbi:hypothetical protein [Deinococcus multiflagellatus]|uniref:hypothetical protein n=1 Tax=Deinococcus multiflagellatus TaxID=1656887 RepID=UPI001CCFB7FD|nr:hypothetical protein [Deinococcus multiflagellatus]MBZ9712995.1 hypothetical protein [Deinococcus multiflagellatus]